MSNKVFVLVMRSLPVPADGPDCHMRLRRLLKCARRIYHFDCMDISEVPDLLTALDGADFITAGRQYLAEKRRRRAA